MLLPGRHGNSSDYRYGFQGKELDNEIKGTGNSIDFGARMLDPRVGRWFSPDPYEKKYPSFSPYNFALNNSIINIDPDGRWVPDKNGNLVVEKGDTALTLATFLNVSEKRALTIITNAELLQDNCKNNACSSEVALGEGQALNIKTNLTNSMLSREKTMTKSGNASVVNELAEPVELCRFYCHQAAISGALGIEVNNENSFKGIYNWSLSENVSSDMNNADKQTLKDKFTKIDEKDAVFGRTVITWTSTGTSTHSVIYYGTSKDGTVYVYTKNGYFGEPQIMTLDEVEEIYKDKGINTENREYYLRKDEETGSTDNSDRIKNTETTTGDNSSGKAEKIEKKEG